MSGRGWINLVLFLALGTTAALCALIPHRDVRQPNYDFLPEAQMAYSVAYDSFSPNDNFADGLTLRLPPAGTIAHGQMPLHYQATPEDALRAGRDLSNPFSPKDEGRRERGSVVYSNYCNVCHGPLGEGNGPVTQHGLPLPASLLADRAVQMRDGQMFHVLTYGQGRMPSLAAQLSQDDRWSVILHVRMLQGPYEPVSSPSRLQEAVRLFRENCAVCHEEDGSGRRIRKVLPMIPDFTSLAWQMSQPEMAIVNQIDYGSLPLMPAFRYRLRPEQILSLAVYVRSLAAPPGGQPMTGSSQMTATNLYGSYCFGCHETTGRGNPEIRKVMPELPDFTNLAWQKSRTDQDFARSILLGKGKFMLPMSDKLGTIDMKNMVELVRNFKRGQVIPMQEPKRGGFVVPPANGEPLSTDLPALGASSVGMMGSPLAQGPYLAPFALGPGKASAPGEATPPSGADEEQPLEVTPDDVTLKIRSGATIFGQRCIVCHGQDGTGALMRPALPPIPDFTNPTFHKEHTDAQLQVSILEGKGTQMPAWNSYVTPEQASNLVAYIRAFGSPPPAPAPPGKGKPRPRGSNFDDEYRRLMLRMKALQEDLRKAKGQK
jgi:mono/diheme cytochrome c family protein